METPPSLENVPSFDFVIPLCPFERHLLRAVQQTYSTVLDRALSEFQAETDAINERLQLLEDSAMEDSSSFHSDPSTLDSPVEGLRDTLFRGWDWFQEVQRTFTRELDDVSSRANVDAIHELKITGLSGGLIHFRRKILYEHNTVFFGEFIAEPPPRINFIPEEDDKPCWDTLVGVAVVGCYTYLANAMNNSASFDIWKVVHQFVLSRRHPNNAKEVFEQFMRCTSFQDHFLLHPISHDADSEDQDENIMVLHRHSLHVLGAKIAKSENSGADDYIEGPSSDSASLSVLEIVHNLNISGENMSRHSFPVLTDAEGLSVADLFEDDMLNARDLLYLDDPRSYIEIIHWEELEPTTLEALEEAGIDAFLPYPIKNSTDDRVVTTKWMLWKPPSPHFFDSHALHVNDELHEYCIEHNWKFPGHFLGSFVVFSLSPLEATEFIPNLKYFWKYWNDCAISTDPSDNQYYLLETIPGRQYRMRQKFQDFTSAERYFYNLAEENASPTGGDAKIRAILGSQYDPRYLQMLRYIPPERFIDVDAERLGEGQNGAVYGAILRPNAIFSSQKTPFEGPGLPVVVKMAKPKPGNSRRTSDIIHEVDMAFTAVGGLAVNCVRFVGITSFTTNDHGDLLLSAESSKKGEEIFLVFARASEGNLLDFVERKLQVTTETESWMFVINTLCDIALGVFNLHEHGIIHGDLHPKNILVNKIYHPMGLTADSEEFEILISDFGEGKRLNDGGRHLISASGNIACAIGEYMPREVGEEGGWSTKADVFCFGRIAEMILRTRVVMCTSEGAEENAIPKKLKNLLERCLAQEPEERPDIVTVRRELDGLWDEMDDNEAEWTVVGIDTSESLKYSSFFSTLSSNK